MNPGRAISLVPVVTCVEIATESLMEEVHSQAWCGNATHEAEESTSGSKFAVSWSFLHTPSVDQGGPILCDPRRNILVVLQSSLATQADSCFPPHPPETRALHGYSLTYQGEALGTTAWDREEPIKQSAKSTAQRGTSTEGGPITLAVEPS